MESVQPAGGSWASRDPHEAAKAAQRIICFMKCSFEWMDWMSCDRHIARIYCRTPFPSAAFHIHSQAAVITQVKWIHFLLWQCHKLKASHGHAVSPAAARGLWTFRAGLPYGRFEKGR